MQLVIRAFAALWPRRRPVERTYPVKFTKRIKLLQVRASWYCAFTRVRPRTITCLSVDHVFGHAMDMFGNLALSLAHRIASMSRGAPINGAASRPEDVRDFV